MRPRAPPCSLTPMNLTPEQALAVFEFLDALRDEIWVLYRDDIQRAMRDQASSHDPRQLPLDHLDPDPPF